MRAAAEDLHHGHRQHRLGACGEVTPQRLTGGGRSGVQRSHRHGDGGIRAKPRFVGRAVQLDQTSIDRLLIFDRQAGERTRDLGRDVVHGPIDAEAAEWSSTIAEIDGFIGAGRRAGRRHRAPADTARQQHFGLHGGTAPRIPDSSAGNPLDAVHVRLRLRASAGQAVNS